MFVKGNTKLGASVWNFSIPALKTCPGRTATCSQTCYATSGRYHTPSVKSLLARNFELCKRADFDHLAVAEIVSKNIKLLRVHVAGDLFSPAYARAWLRIFKRCPGTTFWFYTRSWRLPKFRPILARMAALPHVHVWFSADVDTGLPRNAPRKVRTAWLLGRADEVPSAPVGLVFRTKRARTVPARTVPVSGTPVPVCPTETGLPGAHAVTCAGCTKCFTPHPGPVSVRTRIPLSMVSV